MVTMKYYIGIREIHVSTVLVEASSMEEALTLASAGAGEELSLEYSHTLDREHFTVERRVAPQDDEFDDIDKAFL